MASRSIASSMASFFSSKKHDPDLTSGKIMLYLNQGNIDYVSALRMFKNTNKIQKSYYVDTNKLLFIIKILNESIEKKLPKKSFGKSMKNTITSLKKKITKKNSINITTNITTNITANNAKKNNNTTNKKTIVFLQQFKELLEMDETTENNNLINEYIKKITFVLNKIMESPIKLMFVNKTTQKEVETRQQKHNSEAPLRKEIFRNMTADLKRLAAQREKNNSEINKQKALKMVEDLNGYFENIDNKKDFLSIIKSDLFKNYSQYFNILNTLLNTSDVKPIYRLYYDLLYNLNKEYMDKIDDILLNIRLQILKGETLSEAEFNEMYAKFKGTPITQKELEEKYTQFKKK